MLPLVSSQNNVWETIAEIPDLDLDLDLRSVSDMM